MLPSSQSSTASSLWSGPDTIIDAGDPMQNLGQTWIFYKPGHSHLIQTKCGPDNPDDLAWFLLKWGATVLYEGVLMLHSTLLIQCPTPEVLPSCYYYTFKFDWQVANKKISSKSNHTLRHIVPIFIFLQLYYNYCTVQLSYKVKLVYRVHTCCLWVSHKSACEYALATCKYNC